MLRFQLNDDLYSKIESKLNILESLIDKSSNDLSIIEITNDNFEDQSKTIHQNQNVLINFYCY